MIGLLAVWVEDTVMRFALLFPAVYVHWWLFGKLWSKRIACRIGFVNGDWRSERCQVSVVDKMAFSWNQVENDLLKAQEDKWPSKSIDSWPVLKDSALTMSLLSYLRSTWSLIVSAKLMYLVTFSLAVLSNRSRFFDNLTPCSIIAASLAGSILRTASMRSLYRGNRWMGDIKKLHMSLPWSLGSKRSLLTSSWNFLFVFLSEINETF